MALDQNFADIDPIAKTGLILAEEEALKAHLSGITIPQRRGPGGAVVEQEVAVKFRWVSSETRVTYPYILIDLLDVSPDYERQSSVWDIGLDPSVFEGFLQDRDLPGNPIVGRGTRVGQYWPSMSSNVMPEIGNPDSDITYSAENPKPVKLTFQVSVYSRTPLDDRYLMSRFMTDVIPPAPTWLSVPTDKTWRRMERVAFTSTDTQETTEKTSPIFRKVYTVTVEAEIPYSSILEIARARKLHVDLYDTTDDPDVREPVDHAVNSEHTIAIGTVDVDLESV